MGRRRVQGEEASSGVGHPAAVPITSIAHNPRNPRDGYDDIAEIVASVREVGVLQPLGVVRYEMFLTHYPEYEHEVGSYDWVVLHGNRRLAAAREAGLTEVPVHVLDRLGRDEQLDEAVLIENIHRAALPPLREAEALRLLVERHGSQRKAAQRIGKSQGFISQRLSLLNLPTEIRSALVERKLTVEDARRIAALPADEQQKLVTAGPPYVPPTPASSDYGVISDGASTESPGGEAVESDPPNRRTARRVTQQRDNGVPLVIRVPTYSPDHPERLASVLRERLSPDELKALVQLLAE
jgi:ParB family chromosome partitioning protein